MAPSPGTSTNFRSRSSLTLENLESLPKFNRSVESFVNEQRQNTQFYANEALSFIDEALAISSEQRINFSKPSHRAFPQMLPVSPPLKSRLEMQKELAANAEANPPIPREPRPKELFNDFKHAREELMYGKVAPQKASSKSKRPRSPSDDEDERSARLKERRDRKRARKEIIKPKAVTPSQSIDGDSDTGTRHRKAKESKGKKLEEGFITELTIRRKKGRGKVAAGISLMETFTANNVKKSRLTLQPQNSGKLFKQVKSGEVVKLGGKIASERSAPKGPKSSGFVRKSKPNPLETYSKHISKTPKKANSSYKRPKNRPKSAHSDTDTSDADSNSVHQHDSDSHQLSARDYSKEHSTSPPLDVEKVVVEDGCAAYSDSWGIGSQLPSEASSIQLSQHVPLRNSNEATHINNNKNSRASPARSEAMITTLAPPWNFEDPQSAFGQFETLDQGDPGIVRVTHDIPTTGQDRTAPVRSRFFFSPLVSIPDHLKIAVQSPGRVGCDGSAVEPTEAQDAEIHQTESVYTEVAAQEQQTEYGMASVRELSPVDSLDRLLHEHDAEDALYGHLFVQQNEGRFIRGNSLMQGGRRQVEEYQTEPEPATIDQFDGEVYQYQNNTTFDSYQVDDVNFAGYGGVGQFNETIWEESQGYPYEQEPIDPEQAIENDEKGDAYQPGPYPDTDKPNMFEDAEGVEEGGGGWQEANEEEDWQAKEELEWFDVEVDAGADVLPFAEGRSLLLGLGNDIQLTRSLDHTSAKARRSSAYGQSVQEIEVMALAKQIGHHW